MTPTQSFFDEATNTVTHIVWDEKTSRAVIIDPVLDYDPASATTTSASADKVISFIVLKGLKVDYILETHVHADHLTASQYLKGELGGKIGIGYGIKKVQDTFAEVFNADRDEVRKRGAFDIYLKEGDALPLGELEIKVLETPGHTPDSLTYVIGDAAFVGDTLFMPDSGTARCDFPNGSAKMLFKSIGKIFSLPPETRLFLCHDYGAGGKRDHAWQTTVAEEKEHNIHAGQGKSEAEFVKMREERDATLSMPKLILPAVQVNMRAGHFPAEEDNGVSYLKLPLNYFD